jgi:NADH:ubiquinone oxidoreductase subunit 5 (subunit L)/multisubunit Na+/H+ antiporter MnhA subunit
MLGLVLSDNVIAPFLFWDLTGFTSRGAEWCCALEGHSRERPSESARRNNHDKSGRTKDS